CCGRPPDGSICGFMGQTTTTCMPARTATRTCAGGQTASGSGGAVAWTCTPTSTTTATATPCGTLRRCSTPWD
ncbi:MAG: FIG003003: hypothetical protein, partial [uncultured Propionibacteriaceae bacterium]